MVMRGFALISQNGTENVCGVTDLAFGVTICHIKIAIPHTNWRAS